MRRREVSAKSKHTEIDNLIGFKLCVAAHHYQISKDIPLVNSQNKSRKVKLWPHNACCLLKIISSHTHILGPLKGNFTFLLVIEKLLFVVSKNKKTNATFRSSRLNLFVSRLRFAIVYSGLEIILMQFSYISYNSRSCAN